MQSCTLYCNIISNVYCGMPDGWALHLSVGPPRDKSRIHCFGNSCKKVFIADPTSLVCHNYDHMSI